MYPLGGPLRFPGVPTRIESRVDSSACTTGRCWHIARHLGVSDHADDGCPWQCLLRVANVHALADSALA